MKLPLTVGDLPVYEPSDSPSWGRMASLFTTMLLLAAAGSVAQGQAPTQSGTLSEAPTDRTVRAIHVSQAPDIDGVMDELFWAEIAPVGNFIQRWPVDGQAMSESTLVRVAFDENNIYFGMIMYDGEPNRIMASVLQREGPIGQRDDRILIGLDTYHDRRNAYIFELNPLGTQGDALMTDERHQFSDYNWEGVYRSEAKITDYGWVLEVAIPFTTIRFSADPEPIMGIMFHRLIQRKTEMGNWPHIPLRFSAGDFQVSQWGTLTGLRNLNRGNNVEIKPFVIGGGQSFNGGEESDALSDIGVDIKYGLTSSLTLDLTVNTDFAQVEADTVQVNLTRFSLFFPEKREFFLERAGLFGFGDNGQTQAFFSRRIGIENDIVGGGRLTGQVGKISVGLLSLQTNDALDDDGVVIEGGNNGVARLRTDIFPRTTVGAILTNIERSNSYSRTGGIDATIRFWGNSSFDAWAAKVWNSASTSSGTAAGTARLNLENDLYGFSARYLNVGENFDPALGFVRRSDQVRYQTEAQYTPRFESSKILRQIRTTFEFELVDGQDGFKQTQTMRWRNRFTFQSGERAVFDLRRDFERLTVPFEITDDATIPAGDYWFNAFFAGFRTSQRRQVSGGADFSVGNFFNGTRTRINARGLFRFSNHLSIGTSISRNVISLPVANGDFSTNVVTVNVEAAASRKLFASGLIQYDDVSETLQANIRVDWIHTPGADLFVVLDTGYIVGDLTDPLQSRWASRTVIVKLTYLKAL